MMASPYSAALDSRLSSDQEQLSDVLNRITFLLIDLQFYYALGAKSSTHSWQGVMSLDPKNV